MFTTVSGWMGRMQTATGTGIAAQPALASGDAAGQRILPGIPGAMRVVCFAHKPLPRVAMRWHDAS
jgi:hypothetical protein